MSQQTNLMPTERALFKAIDSGLYRDASLAFLSGLLLYNKNMIAKEDLDRATEMLKIAALAAFTVAGETEFAGTSPKIRSELYELKSDA